MRTTLNIDDDVLRAVRELADRERSSTGTVISELARQALTARGEENGPKGRAGANMHGFVPLPSRGGIVTSELVAQLLDEGE